MNWHARLWPNRRTACTQRPSRDYCCYLAIRFQSAIKCSGVWRKTWCQLLSWNLPLLLAKLSLSRPWLLRTRPFRCSIIRLEGRLSCRLRKLCKFIREVFFNLWKLCRNSLRRCLEEKLANLGVRWEYSAKRKQSTEGSVCTCSLKEDPFWDSMALPKIVSMRVNKVGKGIFGLLGVSTHVEGISFGFRSESSISYDVQRANDDCEDENTSNSSSDDFRYSFYGLFDLRNECYWI